MYTIYLIFSGKGHASNFMFVLVVPYLNNLGSIVPLLLFSRSKYGINDHFDDV